MTTPPTPDRAPVRGRIMHRFGTIVAMVLAANALLDAALVPVLLVARPLTQLPFYLLSVLCLIAADRFRVRVGVLAARPVSFPLVLLAAFAPHDTPTETLLGVGLLAVAIFVSRLYDERRLMGALIGSAVVTGGATAFMAVTIGLSDLQGGWALLRFGLAFAAGLVATVLLEFLVSGAAWARPAHQDRGDVVLWRRFALTLAGGGTAATAAHVIPLQTSALLGVATTMHASALMMIVLAGLSLTLALLVRQHNTRRKLNGLLKATLSLPWKDDSDTVTELCQFAREALGCERVEVRGEPARGREIAAPIVLFVHEDSYLVATPRRGAPGFTATDERVLRAMAQFGSEVLRSREDIAVMERRAETDAMTGLPNFRMFRRNLAEINDTRGYGEPLAVLFLDFDNFKAINDKHGHGVGDAVLRAAAQRILASCDGSGSAFRVGGDEFVVLLTRVQSLQAAKRRAREIITRVGEPLTVDALTLTPSVSIGLAYSAHRESDLERLVLDADHAMLSLKRARKRDPEMKERLVVSSHRSAPVNDAVVRAVDEQRVSLAFQPIVDLATGSIWAFESLARYTDPELGAVSPSVLVDKAKRLGRMSEFTELVLRRSVEAARMFADTVPEITHVAVNLEAGQLLDAGLRDTIMAVSSDNRDVTLILELNERSVANITPALYESIVSLREHGILIALDDYGSANSSVAALTRVPTDLLKLDRSIISDLHDNPRTREVISGLRLAGERAGFGMVIEGIEDAATASALEALGRVSGQGFHFGYPVDEATTVERLRRHGARGRVEEFAQRRAELAAP